jgi:hypothetical protein
MTHPYLSKQPDFSQNVCESHASSSGIATGDQPDASLVHGSQNLSAGSYEVGTIHPDFACQTELPPRAHSVLGRHHGSYHHRRTIGHQSQDLLIDGNSILSHERSMLDCGYARVDTRPDRLDAMGMG